MGLPTSSIGLWKRSKSARSNTKNIAQMLREKSGFNADLKPTILDGVRVEKEDV